MDNTDYIERYAWFGAMENLQGVNQVSSRPFDGRHALSMPYDDAIYPRMML